MQPLGWDILGPQTPPPRAQDASLNFVAHRKVAIDFNSSLFGVELKDLSTCLGVILSALSDASVCRYKYLGKCLGALWDPKRASTACYEVTATAISISRVRDSLNAPCGLVKPYQVAVATDGVFALVVGTALLRKTGFGSIGKFLGSQKLEEWKMKSM